MRRTTIGLHLLLMLILAISACSGGKSTRPNMAAPAGASSAAFPVNEIFAAELAAEGIPADLARFLAAARIESTNPTPNTFVYSLFYPNGSTREITMRFTPNRTHTLTPEEVARDSAGRAPVYDFKYKNTLGPEWNGRLDMEYFVPNDGIPAELLASLKTTAALNAPKDLFVSLPGTRGLRSVRASAAAGDSVPGVGIAWGESAKTGADVAIGSIIEFAKDKGVPRAGQIGVIYGVVSAASAMGGAMELARQNSKWLVELDTLEKCAANPTNQVTKSDPNYSKNAVAKVQSARSELKEVNAVRFLNQATETSSGIIPATAVASIALKQGFLYGEQGLGDYSENTIMREVRLAVVPCDPKLLPKPQDGNVEVVAQWTEGQNRRGSVHVVADVALAYNTMTGMYDMIGTLNYEEIITESGFTYKTTVTGATKGNLVLYDDPAAQKVFGYGYNGGGIDTGEATETYTTTDPNGFSRTETRTKRGFTIEWLPGIKGFREADGSIEGVLTESLDVDGSRKGNRTTTWKFGVPPPPK